ncbi:transcriptional repressor [Mucilaginibacter sp. JRF]|uniref:transcriptional repressor n=1 Tax=Mucilaginibacter sp. JRF TaxID=2780088 RepID=UPI001881D72B|nr:transcriptional repressor [Mucilaginibacter sp. JRF]MBE9585920.1 transcriptional repressor [Mucilaginibacter sp. JRF]
MKNAATEELFLLIKKKQPKTSPMIMDVYSELAGLETEVTAEELWLMMVKKQKISLASVYNYLRTLAESGFIEKRSDLSVKNLFSVQRSNGQ